MFFTRQTKAEFRRSGDLLRVFSANGARAPGPGGSCTPEICYPEGRSALVPATIDTENRN